MATDSSFWNEVSSGFISLRTIAAYSIVAALPAPFSTLRRFSAGFAPWQFDVLQPSCV